jgi:hypothetical protein
MKEGGLQEHFQRVAIPWRTAPCQREGNDAR